MSQTLGTYIREERKRRNWTQLDLAERSGVPDSTISRIEKGQGSEVEPQTVLRLARAFERPFWYLMSLQGYPIDGLDPSGDSAAHVAQLLDAFPWMADMAAELTELPPEDLQTIRDLLLLRRRRRRRPR